MPDTLQPALQVKEINDQYLRRNFQSLQDYFKNQNQLLDFKFLDVTFDGTESNRKVFHGLGRIPADLIRLSITGSGVVTFNRSLFDQNYLYLSCTGSCRIRFFAGNYFGADALANFEPDETEQWFSQAPSDVVSAAASTGTSNGQCPPGAIILWPSNSLPDVTTWGTWLFVDGSTKKISDYPSLYAQIGTLFNTGGEPSGYFRLPAPQSRVPLIAGSGTSLTTRTLGQTGGEETHLLTSAEMPSHTHTQNSHSHNEGASATAVNGGINISAAPGTATSTRFMTGNFTFTDVATAVNQNTGGGGSHNVMNPYFVFNAIIKA
jgi:microcystin-dependent protein